MNHVRRLTRLHAKHAIETNKTKHGIPEIATIQTNDYELWAKVRLVEREKRRREKFFRRLEGELCMM